MRSRMVSLPASCWRLTLSAPPSRRANSSRSRSSSSSGCHPVALSGPVSGRDFITAAPSQRNHQQRVDLLAIEHYGAFEELEFRPGNVDAVEITAGGKKAAVTAVHDAHGEKIGARLNDPALDAIDAGRADEMAIAVRLVYQHAARCHDPVDRHVARGAIDDPVAQPGPVAFPVGDQVAPLLDKEIRPFLEPVIVDAVRIGRVKLVDAEPQCCPVHHPSRYHASYPRKRATKGRRAGSGPGPPLLRG